MKTKKIKIVIDQKKEKFPLIVGEKIMPGMCFYDIEKEKFVPVPDDICFKPWCDLYRKVYKDVEQSDSMKI